MADDLVSSYFRLLQNLLEQLERTQGDAIRECAGLCAGALARGGVLHLYDTGHIINSELVQRAGGLVAVVPFSFSLQVNNPVRLQRPAEEHGDQTPDLVRLALNSSGLRPNDVMFIGSVSGKSEQVVELARQVRERGVPVVAVTSVAHSERLTSEHLSGKRLYQEADLVIDHQAPPGDAMLQVDGFDRRICPASGLGAAAAMWAIAAGIAQRMLQQGLEPSVYSSVNLPGGPENVRATEESYVEKGY